MVAASVVAVHLWMGAPVPICFVAIAEHNEPTPFHAFRVFRYQGGSRALEERTNPTRSRRLNGAGLVLRLIANEHAFEVPQNDGIIRSRDQVVRHEWNLAAAVRAIDHIGRNAQAR